MKIQMILLAAGLSRRFGGENKLLHEIEGMPLYRHTLDKLEQLLGDEIRLLVVTNTPEIRQHCDARGISWTDSPEAELGIAHSLQAALTAAVPADAYVCFVADQPKLDLMTVCRFLDACRHSGKGLGCLCCEGRRGNPAWFDAKYLPELLRLSGDVGGRVILERYPDDLLLVEAKAEELADFDRPIAFENEFP